VDGISISGTPIDLAQVDCDEGPPPVVGEPVVISWDPVTGSHPEIGRTNEAVTIVKYQLVVEREEPELLIHSAELPGDLPTFEVTVPPEFISLGEEFKYEILARARNGNQTAIESCFAVE
jgi:hypothetical protein